MAQHSINQASDTGNPPAVPFAFKDHPIRTVVNGDGKPWFVARDVCAALTIPWRGNTLEGIKAEWKGMRSFRIGEKNQPLKVIAEPAVYKLAFRSNKPEADEFTNWVASEVLPAIRKTGQFQAQPEAPVPALPRKTTAKERNQLVVLVNRYIGAAGTPHREAYKAIWHKIHDLFGIGSVDELTVEQLPRAVMFVQALLEAQPKALTTDVDNSWPKADPRSPLPLRSIQDELSELRSVARRVDAAIFNRRCKFGVLRQDDSVHQAMAERHVVGMSEQLARTGVNLIEEGLHCLYSAAEGTEALVAVGRPFQK